MVKLAVILAFIISAASAPAGILLSARLRESRKTGLFSTLMYYQTFYFTFGFYAMWGQVILAVFLAPLLKADILARANNLLFLLGSPFAVLSWFMLVKFSRDLENKRMIAPAGLLYVTVTLVLSAIAGWLLLQYGRMEPFDLIRYIFMALNLGYSLMAALPLIFRKRKGNALQYADMRNIAFVILASMVIQNLLLAVYRDNAYFVSGFIASFFLTGTLVPLYLNYRADLPVLHGEYGDSASFDEFCARYEISPREKEIIRGICSGLSNQQIADKLFITLQTVKDHTSRIYAKTNCNSRARLITLVPGKT